MSKKQTELEKMIAERDHWRQLALKREAENQHLTQELEAARIDFQAMTSGAINTYREQIRRLISERDNAIEWRRWAQRLLLNLQESSKRATAINKQYYDAAVNTISTDDQWRDAIPVLLQAVEWAADLARESIDGIFSELPIEISPDDILLQSLSTIMREARYKAIWHIGGNMRLLLQKVTNHPSFLAADLLAEWERGDPPSMISVSMFCARWENGPTPNALMVAFELVSQWNSRPTGQSQEVFCGLKGVSRSQLTRSLGLISEVEHVAARIDDLEALPQKMLSEYTDSTFLTQT